MPSKNPFRWLQIWQREEGVSEQASEGVAAELLDKDPPKSPLKRGTWSRFLPPFFRGAGGISEDSGLTQISPEPPPDPTEEFVSLNGEAIEKLATFIDFAEGFTIGFVEINFLADLDILIQRLKTHPNCADAQFVELTLNDPALKFLKDELVKRLENHPWTPEKRAIVWIKGLENSIGMSGDYPPVLVDLNFVRDAFIDSAPYPVLFCLPDYAINRVIKYAPDFWSWKSGVFRFKTRPSIQKLAADKTIFSDRIRESLLLEDWQERIDTLERLAMEYRPTSEPTKAELANYCRALMELGYAYRGLGDTLKAEYQLQKALQVAKSSEDLLPQKASALHFLGILCADTGKVVEAEGLYSESIELQDKLGDQANKAATLHELGRLKADQGEIEEAISLYQEVLTIDEQTGNVQGKAATLSQLGILKYGLGQVEEALQLHQQSLQIKEQIGNLAGKATTLHELARIKAGQGEIEEAIALYQQSLDIAEQIGNVQGKATTLHQLGSLKTKQGETEAALRLFEESIDITRQLGLTPRLPPTLDWLASIAEEQGDIAKALAYRQEAFEISQRMGSPEAEYYRRELERIQALAAERAQSSET